MGYRSDIVIAVRKKILLEDLIKPGTIPTALKEEPYKIIGDTVWWYLQGWKWYDAYPEIQEIERFFRELRQRNREKTQDTPCLFGAMRLGEDDDDLQVWGQPYAFDICLRRKIEFPGSHEFG